MSTRRHAAEAVTTPPAAFAAPAQPCRESGHQHRLPVRTWRNWNLAAPAVMRTRSASRTGAQDTTSGNCRLAAGRISQSKRRLITAASGTTRSWPGNSANRPRTDSALRRLTAQNTWIRTAVLAIGTEVGIRPDRRPGRARIGLG
jgi:hypothetical protein